MAVTKIHPIKSTLKKALDYIENPAKTDEKMLVSSFALGSPVRDFIAPNDVILGIKGIPVNNLEDLKEALKHIVAKEKAEITIFRSQKEQKVIITF